MEFKIFLLLLVVAASEAQLNTFSYVNEGELGPYVVEYGANDRVTPLGSGSANFQLVFFNTTQNAYALGIRMGNHHYAETMRFVWEANSDHPVRDNATLTFSADGNLLLADADGGHVWSTNTSNKGVAGIQLRNDGNLVLHDRENKTLWQSFDYPTDTLLVGQSLDIGRGRRKLVSRLSDKEGREGPYSLELEAGGFAMYATFPGSKPLPYWTLSFYGSELKDLFSITHTCKRPVGKITFLSEPKAENGFRQMMEMTLANVSAPVNLRSPALCNLTSDETSTALYSFNTPRFSTALSFMRLDSDGNLRMYTYSPEIELNTWDVTYERFKCGEEKYGCGLPRKCGAFGLCGDSQCVACPQPQGLVGWSTSCSAPKLPSCNNNGGNASVDFFKVVGAEHFSSKYVEGVKVKLEECRRRCLGDCRCAAFFYWEESSRCFMTSSLDTLQQHGESRHLAFIKTAKAF